MNTYYSPHNRSFKFICLQNQIAHTKNKLSVKSLTHTNISVNNSLEKSIEKDALKISSHVSTRPQYNSLMKSQFSCMGTRKVSLSLIEPYRVIHKNQNYQKKKKRQQFYQNQRFAKRLCYIPCSVITKVATEKDFEHHKSYQQIACRYESGKPKEMVFLNQSSTLTVSRAEKFRSTGIELCTLGNSKKSLIDKKVVSSNKKAPRSKVIKLY